MKGETYYLSGYFSAGSVFVCNFSNLFERTYVLLESYDHRGETSRLTKMLILQDSNNELMVGQVVNATLIRDDVRIA